MTTNLPASATPADALTAASSVSFLRAFRTRDGEAAFSFDPVKFNAMLAGFGR